MGKNKKKMDKASKEGEESEDCSAGAATTPAALVLDCEICSERFDMKSRKPKNLHCGHSFCTICCQELFKERRNIVCPKCRLVTPLSSINDLSLNYLVMGMIKPPAGSNDAPAGNAKKEVPDMPASLHGGRCLEAGAPIHMHCAYCNIWLCENCSQIDHKRPECVLKPCWNTLREMKLAGQAKVISARNSLKEFSSEAKAYDDKLKAFATFMEMSLDCVKREQDELEGLRHRSDKMKQEILDISNKNLPDEVGEAAFFLDRLEETTTMMEKWAKDAPAFLKGDQVFKLSKMMILMAVKMHMSHDTQASGEVVAVHNVMGVDVTFQVEMDRGRLLVHAPDTSSAPPQAGCQVVKFEHIKSCLDLSRALTFLDISLRGQRMGRVYIRLSGCTQRSQCFLMMCTGEAGPSFLNTCFHRLWWLHLPGEHMWAGDHDCGDGSGGTIPAEILQETMALPERKTKENITQGLVAGRCGKANSTIFRVYTKSSDAIEEAAFGRIEYGFHILRDCLEFNKSITEITISGCGVVVEP